MTVINDEVPERSCVEYGMTVLDLVLYAVVNEDDRIFAAEQFLHEDEAKEWAMDICAKGRLVVLDLGHVHSYQLGDKVIMCGDGIAELVPGQEAGI